MFQKSKRKTNEIRQVRFKEEAKQANRYEANRYADRPIHDADLYRDMARVGHFKRNSIVRSYAEHDLHNPQHHSNKSPTSASPPSGLEIPVVSAPEAPPLSELMDRSIKPSPPDINAQNYNNVEIVDDQKGCFDCLRRMVKGR